MFINFSNHPSEKWSVEQLEAAKRYGNIQDIAFPLVNPMSSQTEIYNIADSCVKQIMGLRPDIVMCQGEFTLSYRVIELLKKNGIKVVAACSRRMAEEIGDSKIVVFKFEQFREY